MAVSRLHLVLLQARRTLCDLGDWRDRRVQQINLQPRDSAAGGPELGIHAVDARVARGLDDHRQKFPHARV